MDDDDRQDIADFSSDVWSWFHGMVALSATNLGIELGLFRALHEQGPMSAAALAQYLELRPRPVDAWVKVMVNRGVLIPADGGAVTLGAGVAPVVCEPDTLAYLAPSIRYHARFLAQDFLELAGFFKDGQPRPPARHGLPLVRNVAAQTGAMHALFVGALLPQIPAILGRLQAGAAVLDVGCGTGALGDLLCRMFAATTYTGIDPDPVAIDEGRLRLVTSPAQGRLSLTCGGIEAAGFEQGFDLALLFLTLHEIGPLQRQPVIDAAARALRPGGMIVIVDEIYPATIEEAGEDEAAMSLHFEYTEMLWGSRVPTYDEVVALLEGSGRFDAIDVMHVMGGGLAIATAFAVPESTGGAG